MARNALVINGANFAANKLTTITFVEDEKPCTGLTLSESTKTITEFGDFTLTATVMPVDTTDDLFWGSSDDTVATVVNGVVTVVGLGTATITATCGNQTATCAVSCTEITFAPAYGFFKRMDLSSSYPDLYAYATSKRELLIHSLTGTRALKNQTSDPTVRYPILIPGNTAAVTLAYGSDMRAGTIYFGWMNMQEAPYPDTYPNNADCVLLDSTNSTVYKQAKTWIYEVPEGADSFAIIVTPVSNDYSDTDTPEGIAFAKGIVVKALATVPNA